MELAVIGVIGYFVARPFLEAEKDIEAVEKYVEEKFDSYRTNVEEMRALGGIAPFTPANRGRTPWPVTHPPYHVASEVRGVLDAPVERVYAALSIPGEHERHDVAEESRRGRPHFARRNRMPVWTAFTREVKVADVDGSERSTDRHGFQWMPPDPTDSDWNEAAQIARALPGISELMTPDATFLNAPGMNFRHGYGT